VQWIGTWLVLRAGVGMVAKRKNSAIARDLSLVVQLSSVTILSELTSIVQAVTCAPGPHMTVKVLSVHCALFPQSAGFYSKEGHFVRRISDSFTRVLHRKE
jgi:hypothetical protein